MESVALRCVALQCVGTAAHTYADHALLLHFNRVRPQELEALAAVLDLAPELLRLPCANERSRAEPSTKTLARCA